MQTDSRAAALALGRQLLNTGLFFHVKHESTLEDSGTLYRFQCDVDYAGGTRCGGCPGDCTGHCCDKCPDGESELCVHDGRVQHR